MINASDKTEPAASLPTCPHIAAISSISVFAQISNAIPAKVSVGEFMSFASCNYCHERTTVSSIQISENVRRSALAISLSGRTRRVHSSISVESDSSKRNWKHRGFMETEKEKIDKSDDRLGDQSRCGNTRMPKHPCLLVPYKGTIRLLSSDNTLLAWIDRALHPLVCHPADTGNSLVFPRGARPYEEPYEKCELNKESLRESDHFCRAIFLINDDFAIRVASRGKFTTSQLQQTNNRRKHYFFFFDDSLSRKINYSRNERLRLVGGKYISPVWKIASDRILGQSLAVSLSMLVADIGNVEPLRCRGTERWQRWT